MNQKGLKNSDLILGITISLVIILFSRMGFLNSISGFVSESFETIQTANYGVFASIKEDFSFVADLAGNKEKMQALKNESEFFKAENQRIKLELESLQEILAQTSFDKEYKTTPARVLTYVENGNLILINKGDADNVVVGSAVIKEGCFVGRVSKTYPSTSLVELPYSPNIRVPVIFPDKGVRGFVVGSDSRKISVLDIPNSTNVAQGNVVVTSGADTQIPYGLIVGKVSELFSNKTDVSQRVYVESPIFLNQLTDVFVVTE